MPCLTKLLPLARLLWLACLITAAVVLGRAVYHGDWLKTDMLALLPQDAQMTEVQKQAQNHLEQDMNRQLMALVGSNDLTQAQNLAKNLGTQWQRSGVFAQVKTVMTPDMAQWRHTIQSLQLALLPPNQQLLLHKQPRQYFDQRAADLANPFAVPSLLPLEQDWLGFGRFILPKLQPADSRLQWDDASGLLQMHHNGQYWVAVVATLPDKAGLVSMPETLLPLIHQSETRITQQKAQFLVAGGALFAASAKAQAQQESQWLSICGMALTLLLLYVLFRRLQALWLLVPVCVGLLTGITWCILVFGHVHVLTLVIGTSLVGILIDFPLHWLVPAVVSPQWQADKTIRHILPVFFLSFMITAAGYALLMVAPLPILQQTALFSIAALAGALLTTLLWLPLLLKQHTWSVCQPLLTLTRRTVTAAQYLRQRFRQPLWAALLLLFLLTGWYRSHWHDDIRHWVNLSPHWLAQAQQIGQLSGVMPSSQFLLLQAPSQQKLLDTDRRISQALSTLPANELGHFDSLSQWTLSITQQQQLQQDLRRLADQPQQWQSMLDVGVPADTMRAALYQAASLPAVDVQQSLNNELAQARQDLYLGEVTPGQFASLIRLQHIGDADHIRQLAQTIPGVMWQDKLTQLNELFAHTRNQTLGLKLISLLIAWSLLWYWLGRTLSTRIIAIPLLAALITIAVLGWLNVTIGLFVMFGLLLVSAIGVDYVLCLYLARTTEQVERTASILVAVVTTLISFGLLSISNTPVVAAFGSTVAIGVVINVLLALCLYHYNENSIMITPSNKGNNR